MGVNVIKKGRGRPRKYPQPDEIEKQRQAEFEALTPEQQAIEIATEIENEDTFNAALNKIAAEALEKRLKKATLKSYPPPLGDSRLNVNIKKEYHDKLKTVARDSGLTVGQLVELLVKKNL